MKNSRYLVITNKGEKWLLHNYIKYSSYTVFERTEHCGIYNIERLSTQYRHKNFDD